MASFVIAYIFVQLIISPTLGYFHKSTMTVSEPTPPLSADSNFGYRMTYSNKRIIISAPTADAFGKIFEFDPAKNTTKNIDPPALNHNVSAGNAWFGAAVERDTSSFKSNYVACAPRCVPPSRRKVTTGQCFLRYGEKWIKLANISPEDITFFNQGMDSLGWSLSIDNNSIWAGSPSMADYNTVMYYENGVNEPPLFLVFERTNLINFGYTIIHGNFLSETESYHAIASTYGDYGLGKVYIFKGHNKNMLMLSGDEVGSMYGSALCKANLGDKRASLLVGAPTYTSDALQYDRGAVYLYVPSSEPSNATLILKRIIKGTADGGYFGHAITSVGDLDGDHKDEVAIGAPFEDEGKGVVYIYSGAGLLEERQWVVRLQPADSLWFGFSLASVPDYLQTGLNDLAVSAPRSNRVYVFESIPTITVKLYTDIKEKQKRTNSPYFDVTTVITIAYSKKPEIITSNLLFTFEVLHPSAKLEKDMTHGYVIPLNPKTESHNMTYRVLTPADGLEYDQVVSYNMAVKLTDKLQEDGTPNKGRVLFSVNSMRAIQGELWLTDCEIPCKPELIEDFNTSITEPYTVGSSQKETFHLFVFNDGETAYAACAIIEVYGVRLFRPPSACTFEENTDRLVCRPQRPMHTGDIWETGDIKLEMTSLTSKDKVISIVYSLYNNCYNETDKTTYNQSFEVRFENGVEIIGASVPSEVIKMTSVDLKGFTRLQHIYTITNKGNTNWMDVNCEFRLPKKDYLLYQKGYIMMQRNNTITDCSLEEVESSDDGFTVSCKIGDLLQYHIIQMFVCIEIVPNMLGDTIRQQDMSVPTQIKLILDTDFIEHSVTTTLTLNSVSVPVWVIILSLLFALLLLFLLGYLLYKCKCFERRNKKKLESLKITNDSIRRNSENGASNDAVLEDHVES